jgi:hypothetical protein
MRRHYTSPKHPQQYPDEDDLLEDFRDFAAAPGVKQRLAIKAEAEGCARCGERTPPHFAGFSDGEFCVLCLECADIDPPVSIIRDGQRRPVPLIPPWDAEDHKWFNANPRRQYRLRPPVAGEPCLRDYPDAAARIEAARQSGYVIGILVTWNGTEFVREPGSFSADIELDSYTDAGIKRLIEPAPVQATAQCVLH